MSKNLLNCGVEFVRPNLAIDEVIDSKIKDHVAQESDDAFFVCDLGDVAQKYKLWNLVFPRIRPFYAVKCNDDSALLELLAMLGTGFDCASKAEIQKILSMGVSPDRIIYANPCKQANYIKFASNVDVDLMTFDNENELHKVRRIYPGARLVLRILPPATEKVQCVLGNKFGCPVTEAYKLLEVARQLDLDVVGVSFHVGSGCYDASAFRHAVEDARLVFDMGLQLGFDMTLLDVGGGFPGTDSARITIHEIASELNSALDELFPAVSGVVIIAEPGRYFTASAYTLTTHIIAKRCVQLAANSDTQQQVATQFMYYVNDGVYGSFNCLLYDHAEATPSVPASCLRDDDGKRYISSVWGPTCDGLDCINKEIELPLLKDGDWLYFRDMGSYTLAAGSTFNGIPRPRVYYVALVSSGGRLGGDNMSARDEFDLQLKSGHCVSTVIEPLPLCCSASVTIS